MVDRAIALSKMNDVVLCTFGDMLRVPGTESSLEQARAQGAQVRMVYSPRECLDIAGEQSPRQVIFFAVGFETTQPGVAATVAEAERNGIENFMILSSLKLVPPALRALLTSETAIDGFILPGHVSVILGPEPYEFIADEFGKSGVIAGFEGTAILAALVRLVELIGDGRPAIENSYLGAVMPGGNPVARQLVSGLFQPADSEWRGLGRLPMSGLELRPELSHRDASTIEVSLPISRDRDPGCRCGDVLRGMIDPEECPGFGKACIPERPLGPCMVSSEGACGAHYRFRSGS